MLKWTEINPVLIGVIGDALRNPEEPDWEPEFLERRDANRMISPVQGGSVYLKVTSCLPKGDRIRTYEMRTVIVNGNSVSDYYEVIGGYRQFVLQVQAWEAEHTDSQWSINTLEKLRTRLDFYTSRARLIAVNVDLTDTLASRKMTQTINGRRWSIAAMDLIMTGAFEEVDDVPVGWIQRVLLTSHVGDNGLDMPFPPNVKDDLIPNYAEVPNDVPIGASPVGVLSGTAHGSTSGTGTLTREAASFSLETDDTVTVE